MAALLHNSHGSALGKHRCCCFTNNTDEPSFGDQENNCLNKSIENAIYSDAQTSIFSGIVFTISSMLNLSVFLPKNVIYLDIGLNSTFLRILQNKEINTI